MNLTIFGVTRRTGRFILQRALSTGHLVTVYVRNPEAMDQTSQEVRLVTGQLSDPLSLEQAVAGADAVISALGAGNNTLITFGAQIVPIMKHLGVHRIVSLVGAGVTPPGDISSVGRTFMLGLMQLVARDVLNDATQHSNQLRASSLAWTLVRPPRLTDDPATWRIEHAANLSLGPSRSITRSDLAAVMLGVAISDQYVRKAPMVANIKG